MTLMKGKPYALGPAKCCSFYLGDIRENHVFGWAYGPTNVPAFTFIHPNTLSVENDVVLDLSEKYNSLGAAGNPLFVTLTSEAYPTPVSLERLLDEIRSEFEKSYLNASDARACAQKHFGK